MAPWSSALHYTDMLNVHAPQASALKRLSPAELAALATRMLAHIGEQSRHISEQDTEVRHHAADFDEFRASVPMKSTT